MVDISEDPGWRPVLRLLRTVLIPFIGPVLARRRQASSEVDGLTALRMIFVGIVTALFLFAFVLSFIVDRDRWFSRPEAFWFVPLLVVIGVGSWLAIGAIWRRPLDTSSEPRMAAVYRGRLFMAIGLGEVPALFGFVGTFITGTYWVYLVGLAFAIVGLMEGGPTVRNLMALQDRITEAGSAASIVAALKKPSQPAG
jgi:F0F1-type ATP synthase membrane subunit c/vacuolar-type H+-ATPase subunit K